LETIRESIKISAKECVGYYEPKKNKLWFDEGCSKLLDQRKEAKLQWLLSLLFSTVLLVNLEPMLPEVLNGL
jgi:hypothetical protein